MLGSSFEVTLRRRSLRPYHSARPVRFFTVSRRAMLNRMGFSLSCTAVASDYII